MAASDDYWSVMWKQFSQHRLGRFALCVVILFCLIGVYAPFLASSKPLAVYFHGQWYFPLFRYLFYRGFFTKRLDLFYNVLMFTLPLFIIGWRLSRRSPRLRWILFLFLLILQASLFLYVATRTPVDPASSPTLNNERQNKVRQALLYKRIDPLFYSPLLPDWNQELSYLNPYAKLNLVLQAEQRKTLHQKLLAYEPFYAKASQKRETDPMIPTLWHLQHQHEEEEIERLKQTAARLEPSYPQSKIMMDWLQDICHLKGSALHGILPPWLTCQFLVKLDKKDEESLIQAKQTVIDYEKTEAELKYIQERQAWLDNQTSRLRYIIMPLVRPYHWEDDAGGNQLLNHYVNWWNLTRVNRKDMVASLIFGVRISLSVGLLAVSLALLIGIPVGAMSGYYGGKVDMVTCRLIEIWESMPTFFMLLMVVAFLQSKSIFLVISVIGLFGWTSFSRFIRGEFFKQKQLPYVEACRALGFNDSYIMFSHLLPNAIPPLLTLVPFAIMGAITSEAGLSFLGLGEEGSCSWGVLMDEGRTAFPAESYLLWPPAILLTILLVSIALVGDALRDALDPKMHR